MFDFLSWMSSSWWMFVWDGCDDNWSERHQWWLTMSHLILMFMLSSVTLTIHPMNSLLWPKHQSVVTTSLISSFLIDVWDIFLFNDFLRLLMCSHHFWTDKTTKDNLLSFHHYDESWMSFVTITHMSWHQSWWDELNDVFILVENIIILIISVREEQSFSTECWRCNQWSHYHFNFVHDW